MKNKTITKKEAERIFAIITKSSFDYSQCSTNIRVKLVRLQIILEPIAEELRKAIKIAQEKFMDDKLTPLIEKLQQTNKLEGEDLESWNKYYPPYEQLIIQTLEPIFLSPVGFDIDKLSLKDFEEILEINNDCLSGDDSRLLLMHLVDETLSDSVNN